MDKNRMLRISFPIGIGLFCFFLVPDRHATDLSDLKGEIVYCSDRSGTWRIWSIHANGSGLRQLTDGDDSTNDVDPCYSRDGQTILFTSNRGGTLGIWKMTADGGDLTRICNGEQAEWSPDNKSLVFCREAKLWIRNLAEQTERLLTDDEFHPVSSPSWSPDGKTIAFSVHLEDRNAIYSIGAGGGTPVVLYDKKGACEPHWSSDGTRILYQTEVHIAEIDITTHKIRTLTFFGGVQRFARWNHDSQYIVFCQGSTANGPWQLYILPYPGTTPITLSTGASDMHPDWKP